MAGHNLVSLATDTHPGHSCKAAKLCAALAPECLMAGYNLVGLATGTVLRIHTKLQSHVQPFHLSVSWHGTILWVLPQTHVLGTAAKLQNFVQPFT